MSVVLSTDWAINNAEQSTPGTLRLERGAPIQQYFLVVANYLQFFLVNKAKSFYIPVRPTIRTIRLTGRNGTKSSILLLSVSIRSWYSSILILGP
jgi:hypothetical protein